MGLLLLHIGDRRPGETVVAESELGPAEKGHQVLALVASLVATIHVHRSEYGMAKRSVCIALVAQSSGSKLPSSRNVVTSKPPEKFVVLEYL